MESETQKSLKELFCTQLMEFMDDMVIWEWLQLCVMAQLTRKCNTRHNNNNNNNKQQ